MSAKAQETIGAAVWDYGRVTKYDAEHLTMTLRLEFDRAQEMFEAVSALQQREQVGLWMDPRDEDGA